MKMTDRLNETKIPSGKFSTKWVYKMIFDLIGSTSTLNEEKKLWLKLWKETSVPPRVLVFICRGIEEALPIKKYNDKVHIKLWSNVSYLLSGEWNNWSFIYF